MTERTRAAEIERLNHMYAECCKSSSAHVLTIWVSAIMWLIEMFAWYFDDFALMGTLLIWHIPVLIYMAWESIKNGKLAKEYAKEADKFLAKSKKIKI